MFEKHFHLTENPFSLTPDPRFIFASRSHDEALATLRYWVEHREGFVMVTGEVGTGKTTSLFRLIDNLEQRFEIAFLTNSTLTPVELLEEICRKFKIEGLTPGMSKSALLNRLETYLVKLRDLRHAAILIIDEAQNFDQELLEEVRLLSNTAVPSGPPLLQIALVGQPELERKLSSEDLRQLRQRIGPHYKIEPLSEDETVRYVRHRIGVAGGHPDVVFPTDAARALFRYTNGLPREINQVASQALLHAFVDGAPGVTPEHVKSAAWEMQFRSVLDRSDGTSPLAGAPAPAGPTGPAASTGRPAGPGAAPGLAPTLPPRSPAAPAPPAATLKVEAPRASADTLVTPAVTPAATPVPPAAPATPAASTGDQPAPTVVVIPPTGGGKSTPILKTVTPATPAAPLGKLPGTGTPEAAEAGEKNGFFKRALLVAGLVVIVAAAAALMFWPHPKQGDDVNDAQAERTMPSDSTESVARQVLQGSALPPDINNPQPTDTSHVGGAPAPGGRSAAADSAARNLAPATGGPTGLANAATPPAPGVTPGTENPAATTQAGTNQAGTNQAGTTATGTTPMTPTPAPTAPATAAPAGGAAGDRLPADAWRLQVASFRDSALANSEGRRVAARLGWQYEITRMRLKGEGSIYAVFLGPFATKADADSARVQMMAVKTGMKDPLVKAPRGRR